MAEALRDTAAALASPLGFKPMLGRILEVVGRVMQHDAANVLLLENGVARVAAHLGYAGRVDEGELMAVRLPLAEAANLRLMLENGRPLSDRGYTRRPGLGKYARHSAGCARTPPRRSA